MAIVKLCAEAIKVALGVGDLIKRNISFLGKWLWRFPF